MFVTCQRSQPSLAFTRKDQKQIPYWDQSDAPFWSHSLNNGGGKGQHEILIQVFVKKKFCKICPRSQIFGCFDLSSNGFAETKKKMSKTVFWKGKTNIVLDAETFSITIRKLSVGILVVALCIVMVIVIMVSVVVLSVEAPFISPPSFFGRFFANIVKLFFLQKTITAIVLTTIINLN